jgi:hypothetical protein
VATTGSLKTEPHSPMLRLLVSRMAPSLVTAANELEEQMRGIGLKGQISELVDDQELWLGKLREPLLEPALAVTFGKLRNDSGGCDELHGMPSQDRFTP